jgi:hypothetical protein
MDWGLVRKLECIWLDWEFIGDRVTYDGQSGFITSQVNVLVIHLWLNHLSSYFRIIFSYHLQIKLLVNNWFEYLVCIISYYNHLAVDSMNFHNFTQIGYLFHRFLSFWIDNRNISIRMRHHYMFIDLIKACSIRYLDNFLYLLWGQEHRTTEE